MLDSDLLGLFQPEGQPKTHPAYVAFVDLLGVKNLLREADVTVQEEILRELVIAWNEASLWLGEGSRRLHARYFTDCLSIVAPAYQCFSDPFDESQFGNVVTRVCSWQMAMTNKGFFCRGGFAFGSIYLDELTIVGKGLLDAYELEQNVVKHPRIVLDEQTVSNCVKHLGYYGDARRSPHERSLLVDEDGFTFVNYLATLWELADYDDSTTAEHLLSNHRSLVLERLADPSLQTVVSKYEWVRDYHDWFCHLDWSHVFDSTQYAISRSARNFTRFSEKIGA